MIKGMKDAKGNRLAPKNAKPIALTMILMPAITKTMAIITAMTFKKATKMTPIIRKNSEKKSSVFLPASDLLAFLRFSLTSSYSSLIFFSRLETLTFSPLISSFCSGRLRFGYRYPQNQIYDDRKSPANENQNHKQNSQYHRINIEIGT